MLEKLKSEYQKNPNSIETNQAIAEYYLNNGMEKEAESHLIKVLEIDEQIPLTYNQLGVIYFKQSQYAKAEEHFRKALQLDFKVAEVHFNLAFLYQVQERFAEALPYYKEAANIDPDDPEIYHLMGQCAQSVGMLQEAEAFLVESFRLLPKVETAIDLSIVYISEEKYPEAEDILSFLLDLADNKTEDQDIQHAESSQPVDSCIFPMELDRKSLHFAMGLVFEKQEKYLEAMKHFRDVVMIDDQDKQAFNYMGECCIAIGKKKEAESFFAMASKLDPHYLQPITNLGRLYYDQERFHDAIMAMEQYIKVRDELEDDQQSSDENIKKGQDTEAELVYGILGRSYLQLGNEEKAMESFKESLRINPDQPELISIMDDLSSSPASTYRRTTLSIDE